MDSYSIFLDEELHLVKIVVTGKFFKVKVK
jgi:hypothetical protein